MKKTIITTAIAALSALTVSAQTCHEFFVSAGGGLSTLLYDLSEGDTKLGFGGTAGLGYTFFFSPNWGLGTGTELSIYSAKGTYNDFLNSYKATDIAGTSYEQRYRLSNFEEKQQALFVNIPLMLQYQTNGKNKFYIAAGGRVGIPVSVKYKTNESSIISTGYFTEQNVEYSTQEFLGFGILQGAKSDDKTDLKLSFMVSIETGVKWHLGAKISLYTGIYCDYGLNDIADPDNATFIAREGVEKTYATNSILSSQYGNYNAKTDVASSTVMAEKIRPMAVGLKLRLLFGVGKFKEKEETIAETEPEVVVDDSEARKATEEAARRQAEAEAKAEAEQ